VKTKTERQTLIYANYWGNGAYSYGSSGLAGDGGGAGESGGYGYPDAYGYGWGIGGQHSYVEVIE
jgi:hypothetical protein